MNDFLEKALLDTNVKAFLKMLRRSEGTSAPDGYNYIFGSSPANKIRNTDLSKHPKIRKSFKNSKGVALTTDAAGAYQFLGSTWDDLAKKLHLTDFSIHSQDIAALQLLSERNCVKLIMDGKFTEAVNKARTIWASLPGAGYNQPEHSMDLVTSWYKIEGGSIS